jgi:hypothetical protein
MISLMGDSMKNLMIGLQDHSKIRHASADKFQDLVWTGGCNYGSVFDFKVSDCSTPNGCLSFSIRDLKWPDGYRRGSGVLLGNDYEVENRIIIDHDEFDLHEWNVLPGGRTALYISHAFLPYSFENLGFDDRDGYLRWTSVNEVDLETKEMLFRWETPEHLPLNQSTFHPPKPPHIRKKKNPWDYE